MADVKFTATLDANQAVGEFQKLSDQIAKMGGEVKMLPADAAKAEDGFLKLAKQIGLFSLAALAARRAVSEIKQFFTDSIREASEYERALKGLQAAFALSGRTMPGMVSNLKDYAKEMERLGLAQDQEILQVESLIMQLTRLNEEGIKAATRGAIGLASVFGMDLTSAARSVATGMEGNYQQLNRLIPAVREATTEEGKRAAMMKTFEDLYARAIADTDTYAKRVYALALEWKNAKKELGAAILSTGVLQTAIGGVKNYIEDLVDEYGNHDDAVTASIKRNNEAGAALEAMAKAVGWGRKEVALLRLEYGTSSIGIMQYALAGKFGKEAQEALTKALADQAAELEKTKKKFTETGPPAAVLAAKITVLATAIESINFGRHRDVFVALNKWLSTTTTTIAAQLPVVAGYSSALDKAARHADILKNAVKGMLGPFKESKATFQDFITAAQQVMGSFDAVTNQAQRNREIAIDNEYKKRLAYINKNVKDEEARQKAIIALEAEYQVKRSSAAAAGAKQAKAVAMMEAVVNTAAGISRVYKDFPLWLAPIMAGIVAGLGAAQVAIIAKQPIPLARGAVFTKPTLLPARYEVAEAGEPEIVSPKSTIRDAVREALGQLMPQMALAGVGGATVTMNINSPLITTSGLSDSDLMQAKDKLIKYVNEGLRNAGRKLI